MVNKTHSGGRRILTAGAVLAAALAMAPAELQAGAVFGPTKSETTVSLLLMIPDPAERSERMMAWISPTLTREPETAAHRMEVEVPVTVSRRRNYEA